MKRSCNSRLCQGLEQSEVNVFKLKKQKPGANSLEGKKTQNSITLCLHSFIKEKYNHTISTHIVLHCWKWTTSCKWAKETVEDKCTKLSQNTLKSLKYVVLSSVFMYKPRKYQQGGYVLTGKWYGNGNNTASHQNRKCYLLTTEMTKEYCTAVCSVWP